MKKMLVAILFLILLFFAFVWAIADLSRAESGDRYVPMESKWNFNVVYDKEDHVLYYNGDPTKGRNRNDDC